MYDIASKYKIVLAPRHHKMMAFERGELEIRFSMSVLDVGGHIHVWSLYTMCEPQRKCDVYRRENFLSLPRIKQPSL